MVHPSGPSALDDPSGENHLRSDDAVTFYYEQLRLMARRRLQKAPLDSLQPTELVHEMYERLVVKGRTESENRYHFFAAAGRAMEDVLVERARAATAQKRGGGDIDLTLSSALNAATEYPEEFLNLHHALAKLHEEDHLSANVVRLRHFVGFTVEECADALNVSPRKVDRLWAYARAWLKAELSEDEDERS